VTRLVPLLDQVAVPRPGGVGRPRQRADSLTGDKAYGSKANRAVLRQWKIKTVIRNGGITSPTGCVRDPLVGVPRVSMPPSTSTATRSSGVTVAASSSGRWPPVTTAGSALASDQRHRGDFFSVVQRKVVSPNDFTDLAEVEQRLADFEQRYNATARPFQWKFTRGDLHALLARISDHERQGALAGLPHAA
jgi:hypothetical protein